MRFIHSADWQLGARFSQFGARAGALRDARLLTLRRALEWASENSAEGFIVAGDLFEDNQVSDALVKSTLEIFDAFQDLPVFLLPGNHDPASGPDSVWERRAFQNPPSNVRVFRVCEAVAMGGGFLLASPLHQKISSTDPSLKLDTLAATLPAAAIKIGVTHGAPAIPGKHQPNDFPIALNAATRAGLDYLAIGHWHNWMDSLDGGRIVMPGTPEPDQFDQNGSGNVACVEISASGEMPKVTAIPVARMQWRSLDFDFLNPELSWAEIENQLQSAQANASQSVLRVTLRGAASPDLLEETRSRMATALEPFLVGQIQDQSRVSLNAAELQDLRAKHPILAQVLHDVDTLQTLATAAGNGVDAEAGLETLSLAEVGNLLGSAKIDLAELDAAFFMRLRQLVFQTLREVGS